ncbi:polarity establishment/cellular polarization [Pleosporales sp. CAS-2024a]
MARWLLAIWLLPPSIRAYLQVNYPLNLQFPPVAYVGEAYSFEFAPTTFDTDSDMLQYSLVENPTWLSLDSTTRTLSGTPSASDVGEVGFKIAAAGSAGAVINMDSKLLIANNNTPKVNCNVTQVLSSAGQLSGPSTISIGPSRPIDITFPLNSFSTNGSSLSYYALLSDHTPLPAWISFDTSTLHFGGNTPPVTSLQNSGILLIASATPGYAAASILFTLEISNHQLSFRPYAQTLNLSKGDGVRIDLKNTLSLDNSPIQASQIQSIDTTLPTWLNLDNNTAVITGKAPSGIMSQSLVVNVTDQFGDSAQLAMDIIFKSELFTSEVGRLNASIGEDFRYTIPQGVLTDSDEKLTLDLSSLSQYLHFDPTKSTISGTITRDFPPQEVQCTLTASSSDGSQTDRQTFQIVALNATEISTAGAPVTSTNMFQPHEKHSNAKTVSIIIGTIIGAICGFLLLVGLAFCFRRKQCKNSASAEVPSSPRKPNISRPIILSSTTNDVDLNHDKDPDLEKGEAQHDFVTERAPEKPPKLDLILPVDERDDDADSLTDSIGDADTRILDDFEESSWGIRNDTAPSQHPHDSMKIPTEQLVKRASLNSDTYRKHRRRTTAIYHDQIHRSTGLPVNRRITGTSHRPHNHSPSRTNTVMSRSSVHRPLSASTYTTTRCTSAFSTTSSPLPQPPVAREAQPRVTTPVDNRNSIRVIPTSARSSLIDRPIDEKRNSYIRSRASTQSPFFSAAGSRVSSSAYKTPPAFITDTIVRPDDDVIENNEKGRSGEPNVRSKSQERTESQRSISKPLTSSVLETSSKDFPGSLRKNRLTRPYTSAGVHRDRVEKSYARPDTPSASSSGGTVGRRASTRESLRAFDLKSRLNDLTGSEIFKDAELSDSVYTDEEDEIEEAEKRTTVKPDDFTLPPLQIERRRRSKRTSTDKQKKEQQKRTSKRESQRERKKTSEREPTPFYAAHQSEHGGKENMSSTYSLGVSSTPSRANTPKPTPSPEPPLTARQSRTANEMRKADRASKTLSQAGAASKKGHSRKSVHSRGQSRQSGPSSKRTHRRSQSTAYPYFDTTWRPNSIGNAVTTAADAQPVQRPTANPNTPVRDLSGNRIFYHTDDDDEGEEPTVEELQRSSIAVPTSNDPRIHSTVRPSRRTSVHDESTHVVATHSPPPHSKKTDRLVSAPAATSTSPTPTPPALRPVGLALFPAGARAERGAARSERERTPLSMVAGHERLASPDGGDSVLQVQKGRQTWGGLKNLVGKGGRWVSGGGGGYWDKQGKDDKVFL